MLQAGWHSSTQDDALDGRIYRAPSPACVLAHVVSRSLADPPASATRRASSSPTLPPRCFAPSPLSSPANNDTKAGEQLKGYPPSLDQADSQLTSKALHAMLVDPSDYHIRKAGLQPYSDVAFSATSTITVVTSSLNAKPRSLRAARHPISGRALESADAASCDLVLDGSPVSPYLRLELRHQIRASPVCRALPQTQSIFRTLCGTTELLMPRAIATRLPKCRARICCCMRYAASSWTFAIVPSAARL